MRIRRIRKEHAFEGINATPLIDVVMVLIIFFLLVGRLANDPASGLNLPGSTVGQRQDASNVLIVTVLKADSAGAAAWVGSIARVMTEGTEVPDAASLEQIVSSKLAAQPGTTVQIRADRDLPYGSIEPVLRACGRGGARSVRLATEKLR
ncbi:MAG: biopolymer transporter ExbD [Phycisphaerales bacterium]|nr:biopolymer transporter ExbD [Phycisphaerales bacterium]